MGRDMCSVTKLLLRLKKPASVLLLIVILICQTAVNAPVLVYAEETKTEQAETKAETKAGQEQKQDEKDDKLSLESESAILMEATTGRVIYEKNPDEALRPASITKIMTLLLIFDALEEGKIKLEDEVTVSDYAASMGGSQVFLEEGEKQTVDTMIKCIAVASGNDASVAMAEHISGTESAFVDAMNERAAGLGMSSTHFVNCCGLDTDGHMSSAKDVALMGRELITKYPKIHDYSTIWMDTITHSTRRGESEFVLSNTNKLIKQYQWATGLKTGSTGLAKSCLCASASKDGIDLIAVIMAAPTSKQRFSEAISLLNYGYSVCDIYVDENMPQLERVQVKGGKNESIGCVYEKQFSYLFMDKVKSEDITSFVSINENIDAPIKKGDVVGKIVYKYKEEEIGSVNIIADEDNAKQTYTDSLLKTLKKMLFNSVI